MASSFRPSSTTIPSSSGLSNSARFDKQQLSSSSSSSSTVRGIGVHGQTAINANNRPKVPSSRRSVTPHSRTRSGSEFDGGQNVLSFFFFFWLY